jgi:hypothetical protein
MSPHAETPQVLVLSTTRHELHASLLTTDLHVVGGHSVAWSEHEVEHAVKPEQEGDDTADSVSGGDVSPSISLSSGPMPFPLGLGTGDHAPSLFVTGGNRFESDRSTSPSSAPAQVGADVPCHSLKPLFSRRVAPTPSPSTPFWALSVSLPR